jgi:3',5'-cyclic AMP phosphodiesterase CpdA
MTARPYLSQVTEKSIVVNWFTPVPTPSVVEYGETKAYGHTEKLEGEKQFHCVTLKSLNPSTKYHYRIASSKMSQDYQFRTAPKAGESFTFAVYGDTKTNDEHVIRILKEIQKTKPLFIINTGDLVNEDDDINWGNYFSVICEVTSVGETIPIYATMGNHDGSEKGNEAVYYKYLSLPVNHSSGTEAYYAFNIGDVHFISLNSYVPYDPGSPQYGWLAEDLRASASYKWKIVFLHEPPFSTGKHGSNLDERRILVPLFEKSGVDLVFAGHNHLYERTVNIKGVTYIVTGGGGAPLYKPTKEDWIASMDKSHHFCRVRIEGDRCEITMIRSDGTRGDMFELSRKPLLLRPTT